jgi:predicted hydrocarbon binding protein
MSPIKTVKAPAQFEEIFKKSADAVAEYFKKKIEDPTRGMISVSDERYILVRAASMSVGFFKIISDFFKDKGKGEAHNIASSMLFDMAHAIGKNDAEDFRVKMDLKDPIERLSAGPVHFAYTGWASVDILPESRPSSDENYFLIYDHPYSFESDSWIKSGVKAIGPVCVMNAGYSSGWCEASFDIPLVAAEIMCKALGDPHDRFIMAQPSKIRGYIEQYSESSTGSIQKKINYEIPGFFERKIQEEELRVKNNELGRMNKLMMQRELKVIELKKEIEELKKKSDLTK